MFKKDKVVEEVVETVEKVGFIKKHAKGLKRGLIAGGALAGLAIVGAVINGKRNADEPDVWSEEADREQFEKDYPENGNSEE